MGGPKRAEMLARKPDAFTVPQIFIDDQAVGGSDDLARLDREGKLDSLLGLMTRIALLQMTSGIDPAANVAHDLAGAIADAAQGGAAMLFTPEMSRPARPRSRAGGAAHRRGGRQSGARARLREAAGDDGIWVALGSLAVARADGRWANRSLLIDPIGRDRRALRQDPHVRRRAGERRSWRESAAYAPGEAVVDGGNAARPARA